MATYTSPLESQLSMIPEIKQESRKCKNTQFTLLKFHCISSNTFPQTSQMGLCISWAANSVVAHKEVAY